MVKHSILDRVNNKRGSTLLTVVILLLFFVVIVSTGAAVANANMRQTRGTNDFASAFYVAEAGLGETSEMFESWLNASTKEYAGKGDEMIADFLLSNNANAQGILTQTYDTTIMGETASANTTFTRDESDSTGTKYVMTTTGFLGNVSRTVSRSVTIDISPAKSAGVGYNSNAIYQLDLTDLSGSSLEPIRPSNWNVTMRGPIITNRPINFDKGANLEGPIVNNNKVTIGAGINSKGVIITSGAVEFTSGNKTTINALVLKPGGTLYLNGGWHALGIDVLMIPNTTTYENVVKYANTNNNPADWVQLKTKVVYYNPINFDPWDLSYYFTAGVNPTNIFGVDPKTETNKPASQKTGYPYADYFKSDFVLDNMNNSEIVNRYVPSVKLPDFPKQSDYPWFNTTGQQLKIDNQISIDASNNLVINESYDGNLSRVLKLTQSVSFNSFTINTTYSPAITIDVGDKDIVMVTKKFNINGRIKIKGNGSLKVFVLGSDGTVRNGDLGFAAYKEDGFLLERSDGTQSTDIKKFQMYVAKSDNGSGKPMTLNLGTNTGETFYGVIYSQNLNLTSSLHFKGIFISIEGTSITNSNSGNSSIDTPLIYAPKATMSLDSATVSGVLVASKIEFGGNTSLLYKQDYDVDLVNSVLNPIVIDVPPGNGSPGDGATTPGSKVIRWGATQERDR